MIPVVFVKTTGLQNIGLVRNIGIEKIERIMVVISLVLSALSLLLLLLAIIIIIITLIFILLLFLAFHKYGLQLQSGPCPGPERPLPFWPNFYRLSKKYGDFGGCR